MEKDIISVDSVLPQNLVRKWKRRLKIKDWFDVQKLVVPALIQATHSHFPSDFVISAPTGSGKTLAYALPIVTVTVYYCVKAVLHVF
jgi:superfamily II DNA/RNA helicase